MTLKRKKVFVLAWVGLVFWVAVIFLITSYTGSTIFTKTCPIPSVCASLLMDVIIGCAVI